MGGKIFLSLIVSGIFLAIGLVIYPHFHTMLDSVSTSGLTPLVASMVLFLPYALLGAIIIGVALIVHRKDTG